MRDRYAVVGNPVAHSKSPQIHAEFARAACGYGELEGQAFDLVINATSAGLANETPKLPRSGSRSGALAYDMMYGRDSPFLTQARAAGARASDGLGMLVEQAVESFFVWRGVRPETRTILERLRGG